MPNGQTAYTALDTTIRKQRPRTTFYTLDLLRGFAAILVMVGHMGPLGIQESWSTYLSVDLFFSLSGVVIVEAYERELLEGWSPFQFIGVRIVRLWPLYLLGTAISMVFGIAFFHTSARPLWGDHPIRQLLKAMLLIPKLPPAVQDTFPLNPPAWSLFSELVVSVAFGLVAFRFGIRMWAIICCVAAVVLYGAARHYWEWHAGLNLGGVAIHLWVGLARAIFSFSMGIFLHKIWQRGWLPHVPLPPVATLIAFFSIVYFTPYGGLHGVRYAMLVVLIACPLLVAVSMRIEPHSRVKKLSAFLGRVSYPIYTIHYPMFIAAGMVFGGLGSVPLDVYLLIGVAVIALAAPLERYFDRPVRKLLTKQLGLSRKDVVAAQPL